MSASYPALLERLHDASVRAPQHPAVFGISGTLDRDTLLRRALGAAEAGNAGTQRVVAPDDVGAWLPWLAGCSLGGGIWRLAAGGIDEPPPAGASIPAPSADDTPCIATQTTGTTGAPRTLIRDRASWLRCFIAEEWLLGLRSTDRILVLGHPAFSLVPYAALRALHLGAAVGVLGRPARRPARWMRGALAPTVIYGAPPLVMALARMQTAQPDATVRRIITGGARVSVAQLRSMQSAWPAARITSFYGTAETSFLSVRENPDGADSADAGMLFPGVECARDPLGRLRVRTPYAATTVEQADGTTQPVTDANGWLTLADRVSLAANGKVRLLERTDDRVNIAGALIAAAPLEQALERLPWVTEAAVVGLPDARRSDTALALVMTAGTPADDAGHQLREALDRATPARLRVERMLDDPPRTAGGKLDRRALARARAAGTLATEVLP
ncbi:AMP-binding protein [Aquisalimonas lutea]|uniref:AMP-binding protein n=1 Tax=Aquisalimonas lutea TaxID=1327750 RepID=UPI0025B4E75A|nr:AMP-binding protein [Aquisalimonas lutea]MDN3518526.1 AMP-binding protein [Aquisalimonas lutea]